MHDASKDLASGMVGFDRRWPTCSSWADATDSDEDLSECLAIWSRQTSGGADDDDINETSLFSRQESASSSGSWNSDEFESTRHAEMSEAVPDAVQAAVEKLAALSYDTGLKNTFLDILEDEPPEGI